MPYSHGVGIKKEYFTTGLGLKIIVLYGAGRFERNHFHRMGMKIIRHIAIVRFG
jgi:hypothetical protein